MPNPIQIPPEAYDSFIGSLDAHVLVDIVKSNYQVAERVFQGFRTNAQAIKSPIIRQRLGREIERDPAFLMILISFWADMYEPVLSFVEGLTKAEIVKSLGRLTDMFGGTNVYLALILDDRSSVRKIAEKCGTSFLLAEPVSGAERPEPLETTEQSKPDQTAKLSHDLKSAKDKVAHLTKEKRALEQELKKARHAAAKAGREAERDRAGALEMKKARDEASRKADRSSRDCEIAEQKVAELERTVKDLRRALDARVPAAQPAAKPPSAPWQEAIEELLKAKNYPSVIDFLSALVEHTNDDTLPHEYLVRAYRSTHQAELQVKELKWLGRRYLNSGSVGAAVDRLCRALAVGVDSPAVRTRLSEVFHRTDCRNEKRMSELRRTMTRIRSAHPTVYEEAILLAKAVSPALAARLETIQSAPHIDRIFTLQFHENVKNLSPRHIIHAINRNDVKTVEFVREALKTLRQSKPDDYQAVYDAIQQEDASCCVTLGVDTEPVIVDASNVAYHLPTPEGKPRLRNITVLRRALRQNSYFPVHIFADAALPHQVDRPSDLLQMVELGELDLVDPHTDADETIINHAKRLSCPIVSRDQMADWDPERQVTKIRFQLGEDWAELLE